ncbi:hypothetical protein BV898_07237 [Hypsibius exemplaris]|uniref:Uncharacterized protein n=1 Tax=Hypsibius exemplaris TaxID=2072580 RepID=A0A1W0WTU3_HYPEX|nr:hypothetical protein BV898_07237 [Hypsibius exemplaris]
MFNHVLKHADLAMETNTDLDFEAELANYEVSMKQIAEFADEEDENKHEKENAIGTFSQRSEYEPTPPTVFTNSSIWATSKKRWIIGQTSAERLDQSTAFFAGSRRLIVNDIDIRRWAILGWLGQPECRLLSLMEGPLLWTFGPSHVKNSDQKQFNRELSYWKDFGLERKPSGNLVLESERSFLRHQISSSAHPNPERWKRRHLADFYRDVYFPTAGDNTALLVDSWPAFADITLLDKAILRRRRWILQ